MKFAEGIDIRPIRVDGWEAYALTDTAPNGHTRPVAFLDEDALIRIAGRALAILKAQGGAATEPAQKT